MHELSKPEQIAQLLIAQIAYPVFAYADGQVGKLTFGSDHVVEAKMGSDSHGTRLSDR